MIRLIAVIWALSCLPTVAHAKPTSARVETLLARLTLPQKIGQLMMIGFGGKEMDDSIARLVTRFHIGSIALYSRNISHNTQLAKLVRDLREAMRAEVQPFMAIDQEGGNVVRVRQDVVVLPGAMAIGATRDPVLAYLAGQANAIDLGLIGVDMNLAPVLDVNCNPRNPVINIRAFGDQPELVARMGVQFILGQQSGSMATVAKHFPGHGTTDHDSHFDLPSNKQSLAQLKKSELIPFQEAVSAGLDAIMTAHVLVPAIDASGLPASLSKRVITGLLRQELGFDGLVITDDLEMRAIAEMMSVGQAAVQAIRAGADIVMVIWTPKKKQLVFDALLSAVHSGQLSEARINQSVRRILLLKEKRGTLDALQESLPAIHENLPNALHSRLKRTVARRALTLVRNQGQVVPLCDDRGVLAVGPQKIFLAEMKRLLPQSTVLKLARVPSRKQRQRDLEKLLRLSDQHRVIVVSVVNAYQAWLVQQLKRRGRLPVVAVSFGSPYFFRNFPAVDAYLCTYSYLPSVQKAAALALAGRISLTGHLPVRISSAYPRGHGLIVPAQRCPSAPPS